MYEVESPVADSGGAFVGPMNLPGLGRLLFGWCSEISSEASGEEEGRGLSGRRLNATLLRKACRTRTGGEKRTHDE